MNIQATIMVIATLLLAYDLILCGANIPKSKRGRIGVGLYAFGIILLALQ